MHDEFVQAFENAHAGQPLSSAEVARFAFNRLVCGNEPGPDPDDLTSREREVFTCVAEGRIMSQAFL